MSTPPHKRNENEGTPKNKIRNVNSFQNGGKEKQYGGNGRNSGTKGVSTKRVNQPNIRIVEPSSMQRSTKPIVENTPTQIQPKYVPTSNNSQETETSFRTELRPAAQPAPVTQTQAQPVTQQRNNQPSNIPARTLSAPPNLQEQERAGIYFEKPSSGQYKGTMNPYAIPHHPTGYLPFHTGMSPEYYGFNFAPFHPQQHGNYIPQPQPQQPQQPQQPNPPSIRTPKIIKIIDPDTGQEISSSPPKTRPNTTQTPSNPIIPSTKIVMQPTRNQGTPGGILPELSNLSVLTPKPSRPLPITEPDEIEEKKGDSAQKSGSKKGNQAVSIQRQEYRPKSPILNKKEDSPKDDKIEIKEENDGETKEDKITQVQGDKNTTIQEDKANGIQEDKANEIQETKTTLIEEEDKNTETREEEKLEQNSQKEDVAEPSEIASAPMKKKKKDLLKKAEAGNFKAMTFDAYSEQQPPQPTAQVAAEEVQSKIVETQATEPEQNEDEDDWEKKDVDLTNLNTVPPVGITDTSKLSASILEILEYPPGVWSPENINGKKVYDRKFLMQFEKICVEKPANMPDIGGIIESSIDGISPASGKKDNWRANQQSSMGRGFRGRAGDGTISRNGSGAPPGFSPANVRNAAKGTMQNNILRGSGKLKKQKSVSDVILTATPGRWEAPSKVREESSTHQIIVKTVKGILNKLTLKKFETLTDEMMNVGQGGQITAEILRDIIKLVFDKALIEPKFAKMYAELCKKLSAHPNFTLDDKAATFKRLLLNRCQEEFETSFKGSKKDPIPPSDLSPEEKISYEEQLMIEKKKVMGNITFIGELFKTRMLTEKIMHECITKLLGDIKNPSESDIEALCVLMTNIGSNIDHSKAKGYIDQYFARMKELSHNKSLPSRIRFLLQDVIDLRSHGWVSTREVNALNVSKSTDAPKTNPPPTRPTQRNDARYSEQKPSSGTLRSTGDWEQVPVKTKGGQQKLARMSSESEASKEEIPTFFGPMGGSLSAKGWKSDSQVPTIIQRSSQKPVPEVKPEDLEEKTDMLLKEYFSAQDVGEAIVCIKELNAPDYLPDVVNKAICMTLEGTAEERELMCKLFSHLVEESILSPQIFLQGLKSVMNILEDLIVDVPKAPTYVATYIASGIMEKYFDIHMLDILNSLPKSVSGAEILSQVLITLIDLDMPVKDARDIYRKSKIDIVKLLPQDQRNPEDVAQFLEDNGLSDILLHLVYGGQLENMISQGASSNDICKWMQENISSEAKGDTLFCRYFVKCVLQQILTNPRKSEILEKYTGVFSELFTKSDNNYNLQLNCLYEIQVAFSNANFPEDLLKEIFQYLYKFQIVKPEVFIEWEVDDVVLDGKEKALSQTKKWFDDLKRKI